MSGSRDRCLRSMQGICTHVSDVKPNIVVATYIDQDTSFEVYQQITGAPPFLRTVRQCFCIWQLRS